MSAKTPKEPTYSAIYEHSRVLIYACWPNGNLIGGLPLGSRPADNPGTFGRKDGGDPFERA